MFIAQLIQSTNEKNVKKNSLIKFVNERSISFKFDQVKYISSHPRSIDISINADGKDLLDKLIDRDIIEDASLRSIDKFIAAQSIDRINREDLRLELQNFKSRFIEIAKSSKIDRSIDYLDIYLFYKKSIRLLEQQLIDHIVVSINRSEILDDLIALSIMNYLQRGEKINLIDSIESRLASDIIDRIIDLINRIESICIEGPDDQNDRSNRSNQAR
jgi:hypothetical protein